MSSSASATPVTRSTSQRAPQSTAESTSRPHRTQSSSVRSGAPPNPPNRTPSQSHRTSASGQAGLASVARRDVEQSNVAQPTTSGRSSSRDRTNPSQYPVRTDSVRANHNRTSSRSDRYASIDGASQQQPPPTNGVVADSSHSRSAQPTAGRRRTTIDTSTGRWGLGKTIGAGSMGKVKLAKNLETGEQV